MARPMHPTQEVPDLSPSCQSYNFPNKVLPPRNGIRLSPWTNTKSPDRTSTGGFGVMGFLQGGSENASLAVGIGNVQLSGRQGHLRTFSNK